MTYQKQEVIDYINTNFIPWRVAYLQEKELAEQFRVEWTPFVAVLDDQRVAHHTSMGFLTPSQFMAQLSLGLARIAYHQKDFHKAADLFDKVVLVFPQSFAAPQAVWYRGVSRVQSGSDVSVLKATRIELEEKYPKSIWWEKASQWGI